MKRFVGLFVVAALIATPAFGQVTENFYGGYSQNISTGATTFIGNQTPRFLGTAYDNGFSAPGPLRYRVESFDDGISTPFANWGDVINMPGNRVLDDVGWTILNSTDFGNTGTVD